MIFIHLILLCAQPFDQKLESSLIFFFHLHTTARQKYMIVFHLLFLCARPFNQKLEPSLICCFFLFIHNHSTKVRGHSYSFIYSFLNCSNILFAIFMALLSLYFVCSISGSVAFIFRQLYSKQCYPYISYIIFMEVLLLYFVRYSHGYMKSRPNSQWSLIMSRNLRQ